MRSYPQYKPHHKKYIRHGWIIGLLIFSVSAHAQAPAVSQEFLEYMADFDDENGDILDPFEYEQISNFKNDAVVDVTEKSINDDSEQKYNSDSRHTDMKLKTQSSVQSSSLAMQGATL